MSVDAAYLFSYGHVHRMLLPISSYSRSNNFNNKAHIFLYYFFILNNHHCKSWDTAMLMDILFLELAIDDKDACNLNKLFNSRSNDTNFNSGCYHQKFGKKNLH
ncbi:hypothetical protein ACKWTF_007121 [Chironomus riparius]